MVGADRLPVVSGLDRAMFGYFASKRAAELVVEESGLPWTTLRATQFHELMLMVARQTSRLPVLPAPAGFRFQPVAGADVADRMVGLALGSPAGLVPDIAGQTAYAFADVLRSYLRAVGKHRPILPVRIPGRAAREYRAGANLPLGGTVGHRTWEDFLAAHTASEDVTKTG